MRKKTKNKLSDWGVIIIVLILNGLVIGILSTFVPGTIYIFGVVPFALFYIVSSIILLLLYEYIIRRK